MLGEVAKQDDREYYLNLFESKAGDNKELQAELDDLVDNFCYDFRKYALPSLVLSLTRSVGKIDFTISQKFISKLIEIKTSKNEKSKFLTNLLFSYK